MSFTTIVLLLPRTVNIGTALRGRFFKFRRVHYGQTCTRAGDLPTQYVRTQLKNNEPVWKPFFVVGLLSLTTTG